MAKLHPVFMARSFQANTNARGRHIENKPSAASSPQHTDQRQLQR
ncbi:uncharacterized protein METZ01_LOCUS512982 [marine metagenome]|uniref:Uncharacterized protein n=1 Tax=marine metagenome TaxID=408172 RepID=A0A383EVM0_9ZZZZ